MQMAYIFLRQIIAYTLCVSMLGVNQSTGAASLPQKISAHQGGGAFKSQAINSPILSAHRSILLQGPHSAASIPEFPTTKYEEGKASINVAIVMGFVYGIALLFFHYFYHFDIYKTYTVFDTEETWQQTFHHFFAISSIGPFLTFVFAVVMLIAFWNNWRGFRSYGATARDPWLISQAALEASSLVSEPVALDGATTTVADHYFAEELTMRNALIAVYGLLLRYGIAEDRLLVILKSLLIQLPRTKTVSIYSEPEYDMQTGYRTDHYFRQEREYPALVEVTKLLIFISAYVAKKKSPSTDPEFKFAEIIDEAKRASQVEEKKRLLPGAGHSEFGPAIQWFINRLQAVDLQHYRQVPQNLADRIRAEVGWELVVAPTSFDRGVMLLRQAANKSLVLSNVLAHVRNVHTLTGAAKHDINPHLEKYGMTPDSAGQTFVWREPSDSSKITIWQHEKSLEAVRPLLEGPLATEETIRLLAYARLFHEVAEGQNPLIYGVPSKFFNLADRGVQLLSHDNLIDYGATTLGVYRSLMYGEPNAFLDQAAKDLGIDLVAVRAGLTEPRILEKFSSAEGFYGKEINALDKHLMTLYFLESTPDTLKQGLLAMREHVLFKRGHDLAASGMSGTYATLGEPGKVETSLESVHRLRANVERWHAWALAYAETYREDHPNADEDNIKSVGKSILDEVNQDIYEPLLSAVDRIEQATRDGKIDPMALRLKLSRSAPEAQSRIAGRNARVGFLPMKGDPWQTGHIFMMLEAIANGLDRVVPMTDNSDPDRKPNLSSLAIREPITLELLKVLEPFVEYSPIAKEEADLRKADGERSLFRLMKWNRTLKVDWFYMVGSDHRHWEVEKQGKIQPDTAKKLLGYISEKIDGYGNEKLGILFFVRPGEEFKPGELEALKAKSGMADIVAIEQPMDTSSSRLREKHHWWIVPLDVFAMARVFRYWGAEQARPIELRALQNSPPHPFKAAA